MVDAKEKPICGDRSKQRENPALRAKLKLAKNVGALWSMRFANPKTTHSRYMM